MTSLKHLDLKSVPCPLNLVKIKLALEKLSANEQLIIEIDKGEPEEMVLKNLKEMGFFCIAHIRSIWKVHSSMKTFDRALPNP